MNKSVRRYFMPEGVAYERVKPHTRGDWLSLGTIAGFLMLGLVVVAAILHLKHRREEDRAQNWTMAAATIEDVRSDMVSEVNSARGGAMLYEMEVLVAYTAEGDAQRRWIRVQQMPQALDSVRLKAMRWKGAACFVRWKPTDPGSVVAEVN